jgi:hypothetical protein
MDDNRDDERLERFFAALARRTGTPALGPDEVGEVLKLTKVVAHRVERRYAPLTSYVLGLALGGSPEAANAGERARRVRAFTDAVLQAAEEVGGGGVDGG